MLDITLNDVEAMDYDTSGYFQSDFRYYDTLPLSLDNFTIETRLKSYIHLKKFTSCDFISLKIYSPEYSIKINFTQKECIQNSYFFIGEKKIFGKENVLQTLGMNLSNWHDIKLVVRDSKATLFVDGIENMTVPYKRSIGKFYGIQYNFSRTGAVDYVRLYNDTNELIYNNDFLDN